MLAPTSCLYRDPIQSYRRKRITLSQSVVRAAVRDLGHKLTATIAADGDDFEWYRNYERGRRPSEFSLNMIIFSS